MLRALSYLFRLCDEILQEVDNDDTNRPILAQAAHAPTGSLLIPVPGLPSPKFIPLRVLCVLRVTICFEFLTRRTQGTRRGICAMNFPSIVALLRTSALLDSYATSLPSSFFRNAISIPRLLSTDVMLEKSGFPCLESMS